MTLLSLLLFSVTVMIIAATIYKALIVTVDALTFCRMTYEDIERETAIQDRLFVMAHVTAVLYFLSTLI